MLVVHHAPRTRSVRVVWLLEELGLPYEVRRVVFEPPAQGFFRQKTPLGKLPVLEDGELVMAESGAILEYVLERYGAGRLAPAVGTPARGRYLQWMHYAEGTAYPPVGTLVFHTRYACDAEALPTVMEAARGRARSALDFVEREMGAGPWLLGDDFTAADIMMGFTLAAAREMGVLGDAEQPGLVGYLGRLLRRPAFQRAIAV